MWAKGGQTHIAFSESRFHGIPVRLIEYTSPVVKHSVHPKSFSFELQSEYALCNWSIKGI